MLSIHPLARLLAAILLIISALAAAALVHLAVIYGLALAAIMTARVHREHGRFVLVAGLPLLAALLLVWGVAAPPPTGPETTGIEYAVAIWLRILVLGAVFQWLMLPLVMHPISLRSFVDTLRFPSGVASLLVAPVLFLPEIRRRFGEIADARRAQALPSGGIRGLRAVPAMLTPLVASLLESSLARAELWSHRALLERRPANGFEVTYDRLLSTFVVLVAGALSVFGVLEWNSR